MKLLAIGEVMAEIRQDVDGGFKVGFAGDTYNTAIYCARMLNQKGAVGYLTRLGQDSLSAACRETFEHEEIDIGAIELDGDRNIGIYSVSTDDTGERSFHYWREQSAARLLFSSDDDLAILGCANVIYLSGITLAIMSDEARSRLLSYLAEAGAQRPIIAFDSNYRPKLWQDRNTARAAMNAMWEVTDIALIGR